MLYVSCLQRQFGIGRERAINLITDFGHSHGLKILHVVSVNHSKDATKVFLVEESKIESCKEKFLINFSHVYSVKPAGLKVNETKSIFSVSKTPPQCSKQLKMTDMFDTKHKTKDDDKGQINLDATSMKIDIDSDMWIDEKDYDELFLAASTKLQTNILDHFPKMSKWMRDLKNDFDQLEKVGAGGSGGSVADELGIQEWGSSVSEDEMLANMVDLDDISDSEWNSDELFASFVKSSKEEKTPSGECETFFTLSAALDSAQLKPESSIYSKGCLN